MKRSIGVETKTLVGLLLLALFGLPSALLAEEPITWRDMTRRYYKDGDGKEIAKLVGYAQPVKDVIAVDYKVLLSKDG